MRRLLALVAALVVATPLLVLGTQTAAHADNPRYCYNDTTIAGNNWTHGNPNLGLTYRHGYYYIDIKSDANCPIGADGFWHLYGTVTVQQEVLTVCTQTPCVGTNPGVADGETGDGSEITNTEYHYWTGFAKQNTGVTTECLGTTGGCGAKTTVTSTSSTDPCTPGASQVTCTYGEATTSWSMNLRSDGNATSGDYFGLSSGNDVRFRVADMTDPGDQDTIITDLATFCIVPTATSTTCDSTSGLLVRR